jgi:hypothetical protein
MVNCTVFGTQTGRGIFEVVTWHFPGGTEENHKNLVGIAVDPAEIRTEMSRIKVYSDIATLTHSVDTHLSET